VIWNQYSEVASACRRQKNYWIHKSDSIYSLENRVSQLIYILVFYIDAYKIKLETSITAVLSWDMDRDVGCPGPDSPGHVPTFFMSGTFLFALMPAISLISLGQRTFSARSRLFYVLIVPQTWTWTWTFRHPISAKNHPDTVRVQHCITVYYIYSLEFYHNFLIF
jgi:hypothetical protein